LRVLSILYFIDFCGMSSMVVYAVNFHFISIIIDSEYEEYYNKNQTEMKCSYDKEIMVIRKYIIFDFYNIIYDRL